MPITLYQYLNEQVQAMSPCTYYCPFERDLKEYKALSRLLQAAGHDTTHLDDAIESITRGVVNLHNATSAARTTFAQQGIKSTQTIACEKDLLQ